jgi:hypothetical protein
MEKNKLKELAREFCDKHKETDEFELFTFLADNQWKIYADYQSKSMIETITFELEERDFNVEEIPEWIITAMATKLEEKIYDEYRFEDIINNLIDEYGEDLQEYAVEE